MMTMNARDTYRVDGTHRPTRSIFNWGATPAERVAELPGDALVSGPTTRSTMAVSIDARPPSVWAWLVQIGQDRGGMYSYQGLENLLGLRIRNADRIHPEWQDLVVGDQVRLVRKGWAGLRSGLALPVVAVEAGRFIVLRMDPGTTPWDAVWSFHIVPGGGSCTRLLSRSIAARPSPLAAIGSAPMNLVTAVMTRKMLLGIKIRADRTVAGRGATPAASRTEADR